MPERSSGYFATPRCRIVVKRTWPSILPGKRDLLVEMQLFSSPFSRSSVPSAPPGHRAYAVGDIHGRLDLLDRALQQIEADNDSRGKTRTSVIFLGDLIDRGPDSAGVLERLRQYRPAFGKTVFLLGNHEEVLLRVLEGDHALMRQWLTFGGAEFVSSYALNLDEVISADPSQAIQMINAAIPRDHVQFIRSFVDSISFGSYLFVHAGIRPGLALADQTQADLRWIRSPFLEDERDHGQVVVHGHTISERVERLPNRIGIDTGAYRTGILTVLGLEGAESWLLQTKA